MELFPLIQAERIAAIGVNRARVVERLPEIEDDELFYELRPGWAPARLGNLLIEIQTGPFGSSLHKSDYKVGGTPVINPASMKDGAIEPIQEMAVDVETVSRLQTFMLRAGDIIMARRGEMGRCAIVTDRENGWLCGTGSLRVF